MPACSGYRAWNEAYVATQEHSHGADRDWACVGEDSEALDKLVARVNRAFGYPRETT